MVIFPLAPDQTIAQMWSNGAQGGARTRSLTSIRSTSSGSLVVNAPTLVRFTVICK